MHVLDPERGGDRAGGARVVAGHHRNANPKFREARERLPRGPLHPVGHGDGP